MARLFGGLFRGGHSNAEGALAQFYASAKVDASTSLKDAKYLAVDMETTGLNAQGSRILSIGWVPVNGTVIDLSGARHIYVKTDDVESGQSVGKSALIHHITDEDLSEGVAEKDAVAEFLKALEGRSILAHYAALELSFLDAACKKYFGAGFDAKHTKFVDTFALERRHMERMSTYPRGDDLRLPRVRSRYELPAYRSHDALTDALACAELYIAMVAGNNWSTLKSVIM